VVSGNGKQPPRRYRGTPPEEGNQVACSRKERTYVGSRLSLLYRMHTSHHCLHRRLTFRQLSLRCRQEIAGHTQRAQAPVMTGYALALLRHIN
jgi:hypothetical protein